MTTQQFFLTYLVLFGAGWLTPFAVAAFMIFFFCHVNGEIKHVKVQREERGA